MGKEILAAINGQKVWVNVVGREFIANGHGPKELLYVEGYHPELFGSKESLHKGVTGEETVVVKDVGRNAFVMEGQIPTE